ncbi:MAG: efflux RND transporter permease subunit [Saprospiraceae bacterium]|nr:efflux RND transporter permease subunit [Saprospiraceae bacterium]MBK8547289.1 efflux RND transporter permease subunit [Saprospiraceae bacterium]
MNFNMFFVKNWQFTLIIFFGMMLLGINALFNMPRGEDPPFGAPIFSIVVVYPGTNPIDMEKLIADPIEEELYQLSDIKKIKTTIKDGLVVMLAEFNYEVDVEAKNNDVIREINKIRPSLPEGIVWLDIKKAASSDVAILQTALVSDTASIYTMKKWGEDLEKRMERLKDIKFSEVQAAPEKTIKIEIDLEKMSKLRLGLNQVLGLLQANNINIPGGSMDLGEKKYNVKTTSEFENIEDIKNTIVQVSPEGKILRLGQVANVFEINEDFDHIARHNGKRSVWVVTAMKDKRNIIAARKEIEAVIEKFNKELPKGIQLEQAFDQEIGVKNRLTGLGRDFLIAIFLVLLTLLPLGTRASFIVMISIPLSLSIGLFVLDVLGYTLNQLSIVGMVISLGLLVDDSIVVVENIERYMRKGISAKEAAISATNHILIAILGCTATLILAFLPLANLPEGSGDFIRSLPVAVMVTVLASLFVSITIIPFLSSILLKAHEKDSLSEGNYFFKAFKKYINTPYQKLLIWCIQHPIKTLSTAGILFLGSLLLVPVLGFSLFPESEKPIITIDIETEPGTNLLQTDKVVRKIEKQILKLPEVSHISANVGKGNPRIYYNEFQKQNAANIGQIIVYLDPETKVTEIVLFADKARKLLKGIPGTKIEVKRFQQGPPISAPIEIRILGNNLDTLEHLSIKVENILKSVQGTMYVRNDLKYQGSDVVVEVNKQMAGMYGLTGAEIAKTIRLAISGIEAGLIKDDEGDEFKIVVSTSDNTMDALANFDKINITSFSGALVPLKKVANISLRPSSSIILHFNKERYALVSSFVEKNYNIDKTTTQILDEIGSKIKFPSGYRVVAAGERETREESFGGMGTIIILTVFGLFAILILEFRTFKSTIIVLSVIPMGIIGALLALYFSGESLSFVATVGIIALVGIEIKNSILMVDYTNSLREKGVSLYEAVLDGAETRFLPILLTSLTAIGGLTPLVLENSPLISPLAKVLIGGLISSTLLSRLVTPVLYNLIPPAIHVKKD